MPAHRTLLLAPILAVSAMLLLTACPNDQSAGEPQDRTPRVEFAVAGADKAPQRDSIGGDEPRAAWQDAPALNDFSPLPAPVSVARELLGEPERPIQLAQNIAPVRAPVTIIRTQPAAAGAASIGAPSRTTTITLQSIPSQVISPEVQPEAEPVIAADLSPVIPPAIFEQPIAEPVITATPMDRPAIDAEDAIPAVTAAAAPEPAPVIEPIIQDIPGRNLADVAASGSGWRVQVSSLTSQQAAEGEWTRLQDRYATLLGEQTLNIERADLSKGIFYRVQTGPFGDRAAAAQLCDQLQAEGQDCFVTGRSVETGAANDDPKAAAR